MLGQVVDLVQETMAEGAVGWFAPHVICYCMLCATFIPPLVLAVLAPIFAPRIIRRLLADSGVEACVRCHLLPNGALSIAMTNVTYSSALREVANQNSLAMLLPSELRMMDIPEMRITCRLLTLARAVVAPPSLVRGSAARATDAQAAPPAVEVRVPGVARLAYAVLDHTEWASAEARQATLEAMVLAKAQTLTAYAAACAPLVASLPVETRSARHPPPPSQQQRQQQRQQQQRQQQQRVDDDEEEEEPPQTPTSRARRRMADEDAFRVPLASTRRRASLRSFAGRAFGRLGGWCWQQCGGEQFVPRIVSSLAVHFEAVDMEMVHADTAVLGRLARVALHPHFARSSLPPLNAREIGMRIEIGEESSVALQARAATWTSYPLLRLCPTPTTSSEGGSAGGASGAAGAGGSEGGGPAFSLSLRKRAPYTAVPGELSCHVLMGVPVLTLAPLQLSLLSAFHRVYVARSAWLAALQAEADAGELQAEADLQAATAAGLQALQDLIAAARSGEEPTCDSRAPGPPPPPVMCVSSPSARATLINVATYPSSVSRPPLQYHSKAGE